MPRPPASPGWRASIAQAAAREVREETGLEVDPRSIVGIYSDPGHVVEYADGDVRQQFSVCFACEIVGGQLETSDESLEVAFFRPDQLQALDINPSIRRRIEDYQADRTRPVFT